MTRVIMKISATLSALAHFIFFTFESLLWTNPQVQKIFKIHPREAEATELLAFNQGFYNLFLALGIMAALVLLARGKESAGKTLLAFASLSMVGAALVLLGSAPELIGGVLLQGVPPLVTLICLLKMIPDNNSKQSTAPTNEERKEI